MSGQRAAAPSHRDVMILKVLILCDVLLAVATAFGNPFAPAVLGVFAIVTVGIAVSNLRSSGSVWGR